MAKWLTRLQVCWLQLGHTLSLVRAVYADDAEIGGWAHVQIGR